MTNDMQAPERLFAWSFNNWNEWGGWVRGHTRGDVDLGPFSAKEKATGAIYTRADIAAAQTAAAVRERLGGGEDMAAKYGYDEIADAIRDAADDLATADGQAALDALIVKARREAFEEAAKIAEATPHYTKHTVPGTGGMTCDVSTPPSAVATAIRARASKENANDD